MRVIRKAEEKRKETRATAISSRIGCAYSASHHGCATVTSVFSKSFDKQTHGYTHTPARKRLLPIISNYPILDQSIIDQQL